MKNKSLKPYLTLSIALFITFSTVSYSFGQVSSINFQKLNQIIQKVENEASLQEKVYLHFDKPSYFTGDSIWFKAYCTDANSLFPDTISNTLYVDFINDDNNIISSKIIRINNGSGSGVFGLSDTISTGNYFIRAYTNWIRNFPPEYFFVKNIKIYDRPNNVNHLGPKYFWNISRKVTSYGKVDSIDLILHLSDIEGNPKPLSRFSLTTSFRRNIKRKEVNTDAKGYYYYSYAVKKGSINNSTTVKVVTLDKLKIAKSINIPLKEASINIHFYPEGGQLLENCKNLLAFKVSNEYGYGVDTMFTILKDTTILNIYTPLHNGIGSFYFTPESGVKYWANINCGSDKHKFFPLPIAKSDGYLLHVETFRTDSIIINLKRKYNRDTTITKYGYLVLQSQGKVVYASIFNFIHEALKVSIPKNLLKDGISAITLFNANDEPFCERLIFSNPKNNIKIKISTDKANYKPFEKVEMDIQALKNDSIPISTNFSLAVTDDLLIKDTVGYQQNISNYLLLSSELKGQIENPEYYLSDTSNVRKIALDNLLLTHGWRGFIRKYSKTDTIPHKKYEAEKNIIITGVLNNLFTGKPQKNCELTFLVTSKPAFLSIDKTDECGFFKIPCNFNGSYKAVFQTKKKGHLRDMQIVLNKQNPPVITDEYLFKLPDMLENNFNSKASDSILMNKSILINDNKLTFDKKVIEIEEVEIKSTSGIKHYKDIAESVLDVEDLVDQHANQTNTPYWDILHLIVQNYNSARLINPYKDNEYLQFSNAPCIGLKDSTVYVVNGKELPLYVIKTIDPYAIKNIEIVCKPNLAAKYSSGFSSCIWSHVIFIYTYSNNYSRVYHQGLKDLWVHGYSISKEFYNPDYDKNPSEKEFHDLRSTLYWNPFIITDINGKAHVQFFNSERKTKISTHLEGISEQGIPIVGSYKYSVF